LIEEKRYKSHSPYGSGIVRFGLPHGSHRLTRS
jgi:hypothetical protein